MVEKAGKVGNMVFVKIVKKEDNKITQETLDLRENDAIYISDNDYPNDWGFKLTQEDFVSLFSRKKAESRAKYEAQQTAKEREIEEKLQKIKEWETEQERRNSKFPMCLLKKLQIGILVVALANLIYQIYKGNKEIAATTAIATADLT